MRATRSWNRRSSLSAHWRTRRKARRLCRRRFALFGRVFQRIYSYRARFYRSRVRGWHDDERLNLNREWLTGLRRNTLLPVAGECGLYRWRWIVKRTTRFYPGKVPEPGRM